jgi:hypothetical protein
LRLERQKWERNQAEQRHKALTDAVVACARDLGVALRRAELLTWTAQNDPTVVDATSLAKHDRASIASLSSVATSRLLVTAQDAKLTARIVLWRRSLSAVGGQRPPLQFRPAGERGRERQFIG